jgi:hypothetical protein
MKKRQRIRIDHARLVELEQRCKARALDENDYELIRALIVTVENVNLELEKKTISINRLRQLFHIRTETSRNILGTDMEKTPEPVSLQEEKEKSGHGRNKASRYKGAQKVTINHSCLKTGGSCPECLKGKLYASVDPGVFVRVEGNSPFKATVWEQQKLRCNPCGEIFTASLPEGVVKENAEAVSGGRKGVFTTGIISRTNEATIALYYTGRNHAGENMTTLLKNRMPSQAPPIQMCDALARNLPKEFKTLLANCLAHGRRKFVELYDNFPLECGYVIKLLGEVYHHDAITKREMMSAEQRLVYHQTLKRSSYE